MGRFVATVAIVLLVGCSADDGDVCQIEGTYTMTGEVETQSEGCRDLPPSPPSTVTISALRSRPGSYGVEILGLQGGCAGELVSACKMQAKCDLSIADATDSQNATGTMQYSWTFDTNGFRGVNSVSVPPAKSLPRGCTLTARATGTRR